MDWSLTSPARNGSWPLQAKSEAGVAWGRSQELQNERPIPDAWGNPKSDLDFGGHFYRRR
jgi:hypothetical protein